MAQAEEVEIELGERPAKEDQVEARVVPFGKVEKE
jgi:hypothetical protein